MGMKTTIVMIGLLLICYFISGLFFFNSGLVGNNGDLNEVRAVEILRALDEIPLVNIASEEITFGIYGEIVELNETSIRIFNKNKELVFEYEELNSEIQETDVVKIYYGYSETYEKKIISIRKILQIKDVVNFDTCLAYGGHLKWDLPRTCSVGSVVFEESLGELGEKCELKEGKWIEDFNECEGIKWEDCYDLIGDYYECESSCRHNSESEVCIAQCVQVCKFGQFLD